VDHGLSFREIAVTLDEGGGLDEATARKRFERAKARLAQLAKDKGLL
jgi:hypothetical protein